MSYTDVFGNQTLPPSEYGYRSLVIVADLTLEWPYNTDSTTNAVAKVMDVSCGSGNAFILPDATQVSTGEDFLIRNVGANALTVKKSDGSALSTVAVGKAMYFYLTDNSTAAGAFGTVDFGAGTSFVDAASLIGYGIKAIGASLNQSHPVVSINTPTSIDATHRAKMVVNTAGALTVSLGNTVTLGDDFFFFLRNGGTGTLTLDPDGAQTIDGQASMTIQPGESLILFCSGSAWFTVGYGRSTVYQFSQLVKDVSVGGTFTLTATEASNKLMTFIGNPAGAVTVEVPAVVSVYYLSSEISTAQQITFKTAAGTGIVIPQSSRVIALCDGTNVVSAQSVQASTSISIINGSITNPALFFASQTNTGIYKQGAQGLGITVNGSAALTLETALAQIYPPQGYTQYSTTAGAPAHSEGRVFYDAGTHTLSYFNEVSGITVNVGQEILVRARNNTGSTILNGKVVYINGALGSNPTVTLAKADAHATAMGTLGMATHDIANGADGYITVFGNVNDLNTNAYAEGTQLFLSAATAGEVTSVQPVAPNHAVVIGYVTRQHLSQGRVFIRVETGDSLSSLHDVYLPSVADNDLLQYNSANTRWEAVAGPAGAVVGTTDTQTLTNKTFNLASNTLTGTKAQFDTALSDDDFGYLATANTWTAKQTISGDLEFSGNARRILGDFSNATISSRVQIQSSTANSETSLGLIPNGTGPYSELVCRSHSDPNNASALTLRADTGGVSIRSGANGTGTIRPLSLVVGGVTRAVVNTGGLAVNRVDSTSEGGQLDLNRSLDDGIGYSIDVFGSTSTPALRFIQTGGGVRANITGTGNWEVPAFTKLGESSPAIKVKKLTGTTGSAANTNGQVAHGIDVTKILSVTGFFTNNNSQRVSFSFTRDSGAQLVELFWDNTNITVANGPASTSACWSKSFTVFVTYEE